MPDRRGLLLHAGLPNPASRQLPPGSAVVRIASVKSFSTNRRQRSSPKWPAWEIQIIAHDPDRGGETPSDTRNAEQGTENHMLSLVRDTDDGQGVRHRGIRRGCGDSSADDLHHRGDDEPGGAGERQVAASPGPWCIGGATDRCSSAGLKSRPALSSASSWPSPCRRTLDSSPGTPSLGVVRRHRADQTREIFSATREN